MKSNMYVFFLPALLMGTSLSCSDDDTEGGHDTNPASCLEDTRDEAYVAGISKTGPAGYVIAIKDSNPAPPAKGDNLWTVEIRDAAGLPMTGLSVNSASFMPDHGHGTPIIPTVTELGEGVYTLDPINLFMPGYWETTVTAIDTKGNEDPDDDVDLDSVVFKFCVDG